MLSQRIPPTLHNAMSSHAFHSATQCHYIHMTHCQVHEFTRHPWLPNEMRRVKPLVMSAYDMHPSLTHETTRSITYVTIRLSRLPLIPPKALHVIPLSQALLLCCKRLSAESQSLANNP